MSVRGFVVVAAITLTAASCGADVSRDQAIANFVDAGAEPAHASCLADTLASQGALDIANPDHQQTESDRILLLGAVERCAASEVDDEPISVEFLSAGEGPVPPSGPGIVQPYDNYMASGGEGEYEGIEVAEVDEAAIDAAIAQLAESGRSPSVARCVVAQLIALDAAEALVDPRLGMGLTTAEAAALSAC